MLSNTKLLFLLLILLMSSSCSHYYYAPNEGNVLKLSEAKDLKVSVSGNKDDGIIFSDNKKHANIQLGYSPIKNLGLFGSHFRISQLESKTKLNNGHLTTLAVGTYYSMKKRSSSEKISKNKNSINSGFLFDAYGGYGRGEIYNYYEEGGNSNLSLQKYFLQGGVHWKGKFTGISCVYKLSQLNYYKGSLNLPIKDRTIESLLNIGKEQMFFFKQISLHGYVGLKQVRIYCDLSLIPRDLNENFSHIDNLVSFGIVVELDEIFRRSKKNKL